MNTTVFWRDYGYTAGRRSITGITRCQECHDEHVTREAAHAANGGTVNGHSARLRPSESRRSRCFSCGKVAEP